MNTKLILAGVLFSLSSPLVLAAQLVETYKSPTCGCCTKWVQHMREAGFEVRINDVRDLPAVRAESGIPAKLTSCHTSRVDGYVIEGHVPAAEVRRLLSVRPQAVGLAVPAMPIGSPGMEQSGHVDPYDVFLVRADGTTAVFASYPK